MLLPVPDWKILELISSTLSDKSKSLIDPSPLATTTWFSWISLQATSNKPS
jgi:hypothetical protein